MVRIKPSNLNLGLRRPRRGRAPSRPTREKIIEEIISAIRDRRKVTRWPDPPPNRQEQARIQAAKDELGRGPLPVIEDLPNRFRWLFATDLDDTLLYDPIARDSRGAVFDLAAQAHAAIAYLTGAKLKDIEHYQQPDFLVLRSKHLHVTKLRDGERYLMPESVPLERQGHDKGSWVRFITERLNLPFSRVIAAGNDMDDFSMARLVGEGAHFICPSNASVALKNAVLRLNQDRVVMAEGPGAQGVLEGLRLIMIA